MLGAGTRYRVPGAKYRVLRTACEAAQMGFTHCILPEANIDPADRGQIGSCELVGVRTIGEALDAALEGRKS